VVDDNPVTLAHRSEVVSGLKVPYTVPTSAAIPEQVLVGERRWFSFDQPERHAADSAKMLTCGTRHRDDHTRHTSEVLSAWV
jgi:hypothetical protein